MLKDVVIESFIDNIPALLVLAQIYSKLNQSNHYKRIISMLDQKESTFLLVFKIQLRIIKLLNEYFMSLPSLKKKILNEIF
jgi:hypothetical protein